MRDVKALDDQYIAHTYARFPVSFTRGDGAMLYDDAGKAYIDMGSGIAVNGLGHGDPEWIAAVSAQAAALSHASNLYYTDPQAELAQLLCQRSGMKKAFFCNSGAEANECAIKVARKYASDRYGDEARPVVITMENSFHGRTLATLAATGQEVFHHHFGPLPLGFRHVKANDEAALRNALAQGDVCAVLLETVQGEGGVVCLEEAYLKAVRRLTQAHDALMMVDEVQTGNGRTGALFSYQRLGFMPDVVATAKGLAGGLPMGVCLIGEAAEGVLTPGSHGSTFGGNPICAAAALCVQKRLTDELLAQVRRKGEYIVRELSALSQVKSVTGMGLMLGVDCGKDPAGLVRALLNRGVVALTAKGKLRLLPPLTISQEALEAAVTIIKEEISQ